MLRIDWNNDGSIRLCGLPRGQLLFLVVRFARFKQLCPQRFLLLRRRGRGRLPDGRRVDNESRDSLHGGGSYRASAADQPLPLLLLLLDYSLPLFILPLPLFAGPVYVRHPLVMNDLECLGLSSRRRLRKIRQRVSVRREVQQFRGRRRGFRPYDHRKRFERFKRRGRKR